MGNAADPIEDVEDFLKYLKKQECSMNTIRAYGCAVRGFFEQYKEVRIEYLEAYRKFLLEHYKASSANLKISALNRFLCYLNENERLRDGQKEYRLETAVIQRCSYADRIISQEDYKILTEGLKKDRLKMWYFLVRFLAGTGARVSEVIQIRVEHVKRGYMDLYSKGGKIRRVYFPEQLVQETNRWMEERKIQSGFLFVNRQGRQITPRGVRDRLKCFAVRYGIDPNTVYPHSFRHRFAKNFLEKTKDIALLADLLGHESVETTRLYLRKSSAEQRKIIDEIITW